MRYTVVWVPAAQNRLADLWVQALDRAAVSAASDEIDRLLRDDPDQKGQPLGRNRGLTVAPLSVLFTVSPDDRLVEVVQVDRVP
jgi:hypothetical protein